MALLAALAASSCLAQTPSIAAASAASTSTAAQTLSLKTQRDISITLRTRLQIPPQYEVHVGAPTPSSTPGFENLPVTFDLPGYPDHTQKLNFLLSSDHKTLEHVSRWDISTDPATLIPIGNRPILGNPNAKVTLVNFDDLECPFCAKLYSEIFPDTLDHYKGLIKIAYHDMPLYQIHPWAMHAAVDANCLAAQSHKAYWSFVGYAHTHGEDITGPDRDPKQAFARLDKVALSQGALDKLDMKTLSACVAAQNESTVKQEMKLADKLNINQTPTLFINGEEIQGAQPKSVIWQVIDRALRAEGITPPPDPLNPPAK